MNTVAVTHRDFFGRVLAAGDMVAFARPHYRELTEAVVVSFTPLKIRVAYDSSYGGKATLENAVHVDPRGRPWTSTFLTMPKDVVKSPDFC